jgi:accessory gene regulator protein AgrB
MACIQVHQLHKEKSQAKRGRAQAGAFVKNKKIIHRRNKMAKDMIIIIMLVVFILFWVLVPFFGARVSAFALSRSRLDRPIKMKKTRKRKK